METTLSIIIRAIKLLAEVRDSDPNPASAIIVDDAISVLRCHPTLRKNTDEGLQKLQILGQECDSALPEIRPGEQTPVR